nr:MAG TPA: hypothetical protein [Caudoviricetes sp.]
MEGKKKARKRLTLVRSILRKVYCSSMQKIRSATLIQ